MKPKLGLKRAYEPPEPEDPVRILVERLWPRGLARDRAQIALPCLARCLVTRRHTQHEASAEASCGAPFLFMPCFPFESC